MDRGTGEMGFNEGRVAEEQKESDTFLLVFLFFFPSLSL